MNKKYSFYLLVFLNILVSISGLFYVWYSYYFKISFKIINTEVPGIIIGFTVLYFSFSYFKMLIKLKKELYLPENKFSWVNFKKIKKGVS